MSDIIDFICPKCGSKTFRTTVEPRSIDDFHGAICSSCGYSLTEGDIKAKAIEIATKIAKDALRK